jgi:hypothetical protein
MYRRQLLVSTTRKEHLTERRDLGRLVEIKFGKVVALVRQPRSLATVITLPKYNQQPR